MSEPRKAYLVKWSIANDMEAVVYADSADDALKRFNDGEGHIENTGHDWRCRQPRVSRLPEEDRSSEEDL
jgi:predicted DNA-binding protein